MRCGWYATDGPGRFPVNDKAMKTTITYDSNFYYFETMVNQNDTDYFMECRSLEADGHRMVNNGYVEDGENYTVYQKMVPMDL